MFTFVHITSGKWLEMVTQAGACAVEFPAHFLKVGWGSAVFAKDRDLLRPRCCSIRCSAAHEQHSDIIGIFRLPFGKLR